MNEYPEKLTDGYYYVRKSFEDTASQLARYRVLGNAKNKVTENPGYSVFAEDGACVYAVTEDAQTEVLPSVEAEAAKAEAVEEEMPLEKPDYPNDGNTDPISYAKLKTLMNIRKGNNMDAEVITIYKKGTIVPVLQLCENGWLRIACEESDSGYAYVSNEGNQYTYTGREVYSVVSADSLWKIAEAKLGDGNLYTKIRECNGLTSNIIRVGMKLLIP